MPFRSQIMAAGFSEFDAWTPAAFVPRLLTTEDFALMPPELPSGPIRYELDNGRLLTDRLLTAEDLDGLPNELPTGPVEYELDNGKLVPMVPTSYPHGNSQLKIGGRLLFYAEETGAGEAAVETGVLLWRNPDRVVGPDAMFIKAERLPPKINKSGYLETIPDLVVEVRSKSNGTSLVAKKVSDYLKAGVKVVWVVDPDNRTVAVHRQDRDVRILQHTDVLTCDDLLPGFRAEVARLF
jgi:Uma2 family endonuclease